MNLEDLKRLFNEFIESQPDEFKENTRNVFDDFVLWVEHKGRFNIIKETLEKMILTERDIEDIKAGFKPENQTKIKEILEDLDKKNII